MPGKLGEQVIDALTKAGANILIVSYNQDVLDIMNKVDGWLIPGGKDMVRFNICYIN